METIYRFEDDEGVGPYRNGFCHWYSRHYALVSPSDFLYTHPEPRHEAAFNDLNINPFSFGFGNVKQLTYWFPKSVMEYADIKWKQMRVSVYSCPDDYVVHGKYQSVFIKNKASLTAFYTPAETLAKYYTKQRKTTNESRAKNQNRCLVA